MTTLACTHCNTPVHIQNGRIVNPDNTPHSCLSDDEVCRCGHPAAHHDAGECWTGADGQEVWQDSHCDCGWWEPVVQQPDKHETQEEAG